MEDKDLVCALLAVKDSFNSYPADFLAQKIGEIAIKDIKYYTSITKKIIESRRFLSEQLEAFGWDVLPSGANFIFVGEKGLSDETVYTRLKQAGILVRYFNIEGINNFVRITPSGIDKEIEALIASIRTLF